MGLWIGLILSSSNPLLFLTTCEGEPPIWVNLLCLQILYYASQPVNPKPSKFRCSSLAPNPLLFFTTWEDGPRNCVNFSFPELVTIIGTATLKQFLWVFGQELAWRSWLSTNKFFTRSLTYSVPQNRVMFPPSKFCHCYCNNDATIDREKDWWDALSRAWISRRLFDVGFVQELGFDKWLSSVLTLGQFAIKLHTTVVSHTPSIWHL